MEKRYNENHNGPRTQPCGTVSAVVNHSLTDVSNVFFSGILYKKRDWDCNLLKSLLKDYMGVFFRSGLTTADFKQAGKTPAEIEEFVIAGRKSCSRKSFGLIRLGIGLKLKKVKVGALSENRGFSAVPLPSL